MKASKKLIGASVALVAALAVSVGTTFAWFTTNDTVTVEGISANVTTGDSNLEVAILDEAGVALSGYAYTLNLGEKISDKLAALKWNALTDKGAAQAATTTNGFNLTTMGKKEGVNAMDVNGSTIKEGNYLAFTLAFRTPSNDDNKADGVELVLTSNSSVASKHANEIDGATDAQKAKYAPLVATDNTLETEYGFTDFGANQPINVKAQDAMRLAFHQLTGNKVEVADKAGSSGYVWIPSEGTGNSGDDVESEVYNLAKACEEMFTEETYDSLETKYADPGYETELELDESVVITLTDSNDGYLSGYLRVIIWLEGTDSDCLNSIFNDLVEISLEFKLATADDNG